MNVIYHCFGSAHSSVAAAAIHLGRLPCDRKPAIKEIISLYDYDATETWQVGTLFYKGQDESGHSVYAVGFGPESRTTKLAIVSLLENLGIDTSDLFFQEALLHINSFAKIGGALSRRYGMVRIGRPLSAAGIWLGYGKLVRFVGQVKEQLKKRDKNC